MTMTMVPSAAALASSSESPFMLPTGTDGFWQLGTSHVGFLGGHDIDGYVRDAKQMSADAAQKTRRNVRTAAKPAGPPRGVYR